MPGVNLLTSIAIASFFIGMPGKAKDVGRQSRKMTYIEQQQSTSRKAPAERPKTIMLDAPPDQPQQRPARSKAPKTEDENLCASTIVYDQNTRQKRHAQAKQLAQKRHGLPEKTGAALI